MTYACVAQFEQRFTVIDFADFGQETKRGGEKNTDK